MDNRISYVLGMLRSIVRGTDRCLVCSAQSSGGQTECAAQDDVKILLKPLSI